MVHCIYVRIHHTKRATPPKGNAFKSAIWKRSGFTWPALKILLVRRTIGILPFCVGARGWAEVLQAAVEADWRALQHIPADAQTAGLAAAALPTPATYSTDTMEAALDAVSIGLSRA